MHQHFSFEPLAPGGLRSTNVISLLGADILNLSHIP